MDDKKITNQSINHNEIVYDETGYYSIIPQSAFWELSGNAVKVYGFYKSVSINTPKSSYPIEQISKGTGGLSYKTIIKCNKELIEKKYIKQEKKFCKNTFKHYIETTILERS